MRTSHTNLLVSGICESSAVGSVMPCKGVPSFSPLVWAVALSASTGSEPEIGAVTPPGDVTFPSVFSFPSAYNHNRARQSVVWDSGFATVELVTT